LRDAIDSMSEPIETSQSLLDALQQEEPNAAAWEVFVERYGRRLLRWCRCWGLQDSDAQDVAQAVLLAVVQGIGRFNRRAPGSFRAWLKTIAHRCHARVLEQQVRLAQAPTGAIDSLTARDDLARQFDEQADQEIYEAAQHHVRQQVAPATWEAFRLTALEGLPGREVAQRLGMGLGSVYMARNRVQHRLRDEVQRLDPHPQE
jgi:RNA polymerase sigma-70 factor (ECF subfamily)